MQVAALENYRGSLNNIVVVTFDELLQRIKDTLTVFKTEESTVDLLDTIDEGELPF